jgi:adenylate cyclase
MDQADTLLASIVLGASACSLGLMLLTARGQTRSNVGIGISYILVGAAIPLANHLAGDVGSGLEPLARFEGLLEVGAAAAAAYYVNSLAATSTAVSGRKRRIALTVRATYALSVVIGALGLAAPDARLNEFQFRVFTDGPAHTGFWLFVPLWILLTLLFMYAYLLLARENLDVGERVRATCALIASPLLVGGLMAPRGVVLVLGTASMVITLYGIYHHAIAQGERSAFLSRFLSPHVAAQVRQDGLTSIVQPAEVELTVVACDLRGFTAYAEAVPSQAVIDLLGDYYDAVGRVVAEVDGTVKDYAGDGILVLIGAPLPRADHAEAGLRLAQRIHQAVAPVLERWSTRPHPLGIGVGVATGQVTVGAIGSDARMEYTAVGTPVNLAARLCSRAEAGQTLVAEATAAASTSPDLVERGAVELKGLTGSLAVFELATSRATD